MPSEIFFTAAGTAETIGLTIDCIALIVLLIGAIRGGFRGLSGEVARICGLGASVGVGLFCAGWVGGLMQDWLPKAHILRGTLTVIALITLSALIGCMVKYILDKSLRLIVDQPANAVLGIIAGGLRALVLVIAVYFLASFVAYGVFGEAMFKDSKLGRHLKPAVQWTREKLGAEPGSMPTWLTEVPK